MVLYCLFSSHVSMYSADLTWWHVAWWFHISTDVNKNASSSIKHEYLLDWTGFHNSISAKRISWKKNCCKNIWGWENELGLRQRSPVLRDTELYPLLLCFQIQSIDKNDLLYHCKIVPILQKCVYNVKTMSVCYCWTKQLTVPTFSPCIWVQIKLLGWVRCGACLYQFLIFATFLSL